MSAACGGSDEPADRDPSGGTGTAPDLAEVLGEENPGQGEPVTVGFISDGRSAAIDNSFQLVAAQATFAYIDDYMGGIGGRPLNVVQCETNAEPGKATDCANRLVSEGVVAVAMPDSVTAVSIHTVLKENGVPLFVYGVGDAPLLLDDQAVFALLDPLSGLADSPISVAQKHGLDRVTAVVVDVPAATAFYEAMGAQSFADAGIELDLVAIPPDQADMTPQMSRIAGGEPTAVHIVGHDAFCIAAINGLHATGFDGPVSMLSGSCDTPSVKTALGSKLDGVYVSSATANGDLEEEGIRLWNAIVDHYDADVDPEQGAATFIAVMSMRLALEGISGDISPETAISTIRAMEPTELPGGAGVLFRCNGKARPLLPAVCSNANLRSQLDDTGEVTLPWTLVGDNDIPD